jgi:membrane protein YqaA with SNARE-associated domain
MKNTVEDWLERLRTSRHAMRLLFAGSFAETIIVPIPIELILVPYMALNRPKLWRAASVVLAGCLAASLVGYLIGYLFFETVGEWAIATFGWEAGYAEFSAMFERYGFLAVIAVGIIPIPFQIGMLTAGATGYPLALFLLAAIIARGVRYYGLALLVYLFGETLLEEWRRNRRRVLVGGGLILLAMLAAYYGFVRLH